jgi:hypothetical protein
MRHSMNYHRILFLLLLFQSRNAFGQNGLKDAARTIMAADSVVLITHITVNEYHDKTDVELPGMMDTTLSKKVTFLSLLQGNSINPAVVVQRQPLTKTEVGLFAAIVRKPVKHYRIGFVPLCFEPHHAVLVYRNGRMSYVDLCFHCRELATSTDFNLDNMDFKDGKWKQLQKFFTDRGLTYEMPDPRK